MCHGHAARAVELTNPSCYGAQRDSNGTIIFLRSTLVVLPLPHSTHSPTPLPLKQTKQKIQAYYMLLKLNQLDPIHDARMEDDAAAFGTGTGAEFEMRNMAGNIMGWDWDED